MMPQFNHTTDCPYDAFSKRMEDKMLHINALLMVNVVLVSLIVGIGAYGGQRYRHQTFTRFLYHGANSLFVPIMSYTVSAFSSVDVTGFMSDKAPIVAFCDAVSQRIAVLHIASLVQVIAINTSTLVAGDDREGHTIGPPFILLLQTIWNSYLAIYISGYSPSTHRFSLDKAISEIKEGIGFTLFAPLVIIYVKMAFKVCAFYMTRRSYALGRNPRLLVGYMQSHHDEQEPPPLLVMGEDKMQIEKKPHGYCLSEEGGTKEKKSLVTIDKIWQLDDMVFSSTTPQMKDVCFSFSLFKMLRCRFAKYGMAEVSFHKVSNFFWNVLLRNDDNGERVLGVITDELCFLYDYYYSSLPTSYSNHWLVIMNMLISIVSMSYFSYHGVSAVKELVVAAFSREKRSISQVLCDVQCNGISGGSYHFGDFYNLVLPIVFLLALIALSEVKEIIAYICSKWTKVAIICCYIKHGSWLRSPIMQKCIRLVLRCRCKPLTHWEDKMNQSSILRPKKVFLQHLISLLPGQKKKVKVPIAVKFALLNLLKSYEESNSVPSLRRSIQVGNSLYFTYHGKGMADTVLVYHIGTSIFEMISDSDHPPSEHKVAATHLSQYCTYLVAYCPELLPEDDDWCKSLYKATKKDAECILISKIAATTAEAEYQQLVEMLEAGSKNEVLKRGVELGKLLAGLVEMEEMVWEVLAAFWSDIMLYAAPSDNIDGHLEAVARGGELITLLWALLMHVGIVNRPEATAAATDGVVAPAGSGVATVSEEVMPNAYQRQAVPGTSGEIIMEIIDKAVPGTSGEIMMEIIDKEDGGNGAQEK